MPRHPNYWDHTEKERAAMTSEDVNKLLDYELMLQGVLKVVPPVYEEEESIELNTETVFGIKIWYNSTLAFRDPELAKQFIALKPCILESNYGIEYKGSSVTYMKEQDKVSVESLEVFLEHEVVNARSILDRNKEIKGRNEKLKREYNESCKAMKDACKNLWEDWYDCREKDDKYQRILRTLEEYRALANGKEDIARQFLGKAFSSDDIEAADKWSLE